MPSYRVTQKCFHSGAMYEPGGKRDVIVTDKPIHPIPAHMVEIKESAESREAREANEAERLRVEKAKREQMNKDVKDVDFLNAPQSGAVETL